MYFQLSSSTDDIIKTFLDQNLKKYIKGIFQAIGHENLISRANLESQSKISGAQKYLQEIMMFDNGLRMAKFNIEMLKQFVENQVENTSGSKHGRL